MQAEEFDFFKDLALEKKEGRETITKDEYTLIWAVMEMAKALFTWATFMALFFVLPISLFVYVFQHYLM
ncbi:hypothetical protein A8E62_32190 [Burkholderia cenocepacia]|nr:hypothetical protein A8E62_32190 [Burkholderia cenocepacia]